MTDFRAWGTIMGLTGLTAVFGMGTGVAPPVSSPGNRPAGDEATPAAPSGTAVGRSRRRVPVGGPRVGVMAPSISRRTRVAGMTLPGGRDHAEARPATMRFGAEGSGWSSRLAVRTGRLRRSPAVHSRPIDLVVFQEPMVPEGTRKPRLGGGFALRCLQRLSGPDLATRRCPERDSRYTRGRSSPILSY